MKIFDRKKYILLGLLISLLIFGFGLMAGPEAVDGEFNVAMFSFRRLTLAPILILAAYGSMIFLIFKRK
ncbi:DUF3098 domain-containing protein [Draconibacterium sp. IB214405]|uniref:DUF3098 domain-containing protein n=1 Tax=Draconibacterium sp. IB214405 TaxID=3097352 RepID=UPI002A0D973C|nr:DUF3098 domain-containing protein [Draconibacterium sp. IB214405]MDX8339083.1 DUF3098 domain-containing protein [Draconibacterium sp. IB214405]